MVHYSGEVKVPSEVCYGQFTVRASSEYALTGQRVHPDLIRAYAMIKKSAALVNMELNVLDKVKGRTIIRSCDEILEKNWKMNS